MIEIDVKQIETTYEAPKLPEVEEGVKLTKKKTNANTYRGWLNGCIQKAVKKNNKTMELLFIELLRKFNTYYPEKIIKVEILQGYKDYQRAHPDIWKDINNNVLIRIWHKGGHENKVIESSHINAFLRVLRRFKVGEEITCYRIAKELGYGKTEEEAWQELWKKRMTDYFPKYYRVCLFLQKICVIDYSKDGRVTRLK